MLSEDYRRHTYHLALSLIFIFILYCSVALIIDPLQLLHKTWIFPDRLCKDMREQSAGIIRTHEFDSMILGTSILQDMSAKEASQKLGDTFFSFCPSASTLYERRIIFNFASHIKVIKNVILSLDDYYLTQTREHPMYPLKFWAYLYDDNRINDLKIYFTPSFIKKMFSRKQFLAKVDMDRPLNVIDDPKYQRLGGLQNWVHDLHDWQTREFLTKTLPDMAQQCSAISPQKPVNNENFTRIRAYLDDNVIAIVKSNPQTNFYLVFPPYFRYKFAVWQQKDPQTYHDHKYAVGYLVSQTAFYPNMFVYGFENRDFLDNIANYYDTTHFGSDFTSLILNEIRDGTARLTPETVEGYLNESEQRAKEFDIPALNDTAQQLIAAHIHL